MSGAVRIHRPRKRFGQNFLRDPRYISRIIDVVAPGPGDRLIEIGPGDGALTLPLAAAAGRLDCIELDRDLARQLDLRFTGQDHVRIHCHNILKFDLGELADKGNRLRIVGNLPYNISTPVIFHLLKMSRIITDMTFMLQKEVVERMTAAPGSRDYGRLSVMLQYYCAAEQMFLVPPEAFRPRPKVISAIVRLKPQRPPPIKAADENCFETVVRTAFGQRRKTLRNSLKPLLEGGIADVLPVDLGARPEQLSLADYVGISDAISAIGEK